MANYRTPKSAHQLDELLQSLGSSLPASEVEGFLTKATRSSIVHREDSLDVLQSQCPDRAAFDAKYLEVKEKNYETLGSYVELMARLSEDAKLKKYLRKLSGTSSMVNGSSKHLSGPSDVTVDSIQLVKNKLKAERSELKRSEEDHKLDHSNHHDSRHNSTLSQYSIFPEWFNTRSSISRDFIVTEPAADRLLTLVNICAQSQENALLADLVNCLAGVDGTHIVALSLTDPYANRAFQLAEGTDTALKEMCSKILILASHYSLVVRFVEQKYDFRYGRVNNSLSAAMDDYLMEYMTFVVQIGSQHRRGDLRLQQLLFLIQPMLHIMNVLAHIAGAINRVDARGGKVLTLLHQNSVKLTGDTEGKQICLQLTQAASKPYLASLDTWLLCGVIEDPFNEFLVEDNQVEGDFGDIDRTSSLDDCDGYWGKRYSVRRERMPSFLFSHADKILRTGKYLNVIRQCGKNAKSAQVERTKYTHQGRECELAIEKAYQFASKTLLDILMTEYDLKGRLRWMKHFFLLEQGDFVSQFMDAAEAELHKPVLEVEPTRLESLLGLVLRTSSAAAAMGGCYLEDLHTKLLTCSLPAQMTHILAIRGKNSDTSSSGRGSIASADLEESALTGMEGFTFSVDVKWPVSLVLSSHELLNYQILFRHLFFIKHVERVLCRVWSSHKVAKVFPVQESVHYRPAFALRQRMLTCVQSLECYMTSEVIEPNWNLFMDRIKKVTSVDDVLICHSDFLNQCQLECMLTITELLLPLRHLLDCCTSFCTFLMHMRKYFVEAELGSELTESIDPMETVDLQNIDKEGKFDSQILIYEQKFSSLLHELLERVSKLGRDAANSKLLNVLYTLDFNGFYSSLLRKDGHTSSILGVTSG